MASFDSHAMGVYFIIPGLADAISLLLIGYLIAPRIAEFLGTLSVAEAMGNLYGKQVRIISAISGIFPAIGNVAIQFVILPALLSHLLGISGLYATIISGAIVIIYSAFGGIKAITFTDMIQFFTFGVVIPITAILIWKSLDNTNAFLNTLTQNPIFDYTQVLDYHNPNFFKTLMLFFFFLIPGLDPAIFQRIAMAQNTTQVSKSFIISSLIIFFCVYSVFWCIGALLLADNYVLDSNGQFFYPSNLTYILDNYMGTGFKGLFIIGVIAMLMSTADSYINCAAVLFTHDFCKSIGIQLTVKKELILVRVSAVFIGISALLLSLYSTNLLNLVLSTYSFYMPIVSVPLLLAIFGFRSTSKSVLLGMMSGFFTVMAFKLLTDIDSLMPGMMANLIVFVASHYLLSQEGGWVGVKDRQPLENIRRKRKRRINNLIQTITNFSFLTFCKNNTPKSGSMYVYFGFFCIISVFSTIYSLPRIVGIQYQIVLDFIYYSTLVISTIFITYPVWNPSFKNETFISILWNTAIFYNLIFASSLLVIISNYNQLQFTILMANLITAAILLRWQVALFMIFGGIWASLEFYKWYFFKVNEFSVNSSSLEFKIIYSLLLTSTILISFLKPKQEQQQLSDEKVDHLSYRITDREQALTTANGLQNEFIRNLTHEFHAPMTGVRSTAETLYETYDLITEKMRKMAVENIYKSAVRLEVFERNLELLSRLANAHYNLNYAKLDLSQLVYERVEKCMKMYIEERDQGKPEFILQIENEITANCDAYHIRQTIDNLIINAISYCQQGKITVSLKKNGDEIEFAIKDEGIGVPPEEIYDIFGTFIVSSRTRTPAGGRGIGLALCKKVIDLHQGRIWAENNQDKGATFRFTIPLSN